MIVPRTEVPSITEYRFDEFRVDIMRRTLFREGVAVLIPSKVFSLLHIFVQVPGVAITKTDLMKTLWPDSYVEPGNLTQAIFLLRRALEGDGKEHRYIVTIPGQGYLFSGDVKAPIKSEPSETSQNPAKIRSLAILPFQVLAAPSNLHYLGIGIADALTSRLSCIREVRVRPLSTARPSGQHQDPLAIGRELAVDLILTGNVQIEHRRPRSASRIRVSLQLTQVQEGVILWSDIVKHELSHLLQLQDILAQTVGDVLSSKLSAQERERLTKRHTQHSEAYSAYLKGRHYANQSTARGQVKALECFTKAVTLDPNFALAYSGIADANYIVSNIHLPSNEAMPRAMAAAQRALELDPTLAEAHTSLALNHGFYEWDSQKSEAEFRRAIMLNPEYSSAHLWYGRLLTTQGRFEEAQAHLTKAQIQDPLSSSINAEIGRTLFYAGRYKEAAEQLRETLELNSLFWPAHLFLGWVYEQQGLITEALAILEQCNALDDNPRTKAFLGAAYALAGEQKKAEQILEQLVRQDVKRRMSGYYISVIYAALGKRDMTFRSLEKAYADRSVGFIWLRVEPRFDALRGDPRFERLLMKIGNQGSTHRGA
jgi:DNA-binding winged helix-turn-helix (wHTH) protein/Tfp pilus assembly protein PilF